MKTVIRIEHPDTGLGMWRTVLSDSYKPIFRSFSFVDEMIQSHRQFPLPFEDEGLHYIEEEEYCAFKSVNQMKRWIKNEWLDEMISFGFRVYEVTISKYREGRYQILYRKDNLLDQNDITHLFSLVNQN